MKQFKVEKDVPFIPYRKYPLGDMEVGDSFLVPFTDLQHYKDPRSGIYSAISYYAKRNGGKFACRKVKEGIRVWRRK